MNEVMLQQYNLIQKSCSVTAIGGIDSIRDERLLNSALQSLGTDA